MMKGIQLAVLAFLAGVSVAHAEIVAIVEDGNKVEYNGLDGANSFVYDESAQKISVTLPYQFFRQYQYFRDLKAEFKKPVPKDSKGEDLFTFVTMEFSSEGCVMKRVRELEDLGDKVLEGPFSEVALYVCGDRGPIPVKLTRKWQIVPQNGSNDIETLDNISMHIERFQTSVAGSEEMVQVKSEENGKFVYRRGIQVDPLYAVAFEPKGWEMMPLAYIKLALPAE